MQAANDYYSVLGIERDASLDEIHGAYRRLAREWHPDRNPGRAEAPETFRRITEAYHILADPAQRQAYDAGVTVGVPGHTDIEGTVTVGLTDLFLGANVRFPVPHAVLCAACSGRGRSASAGDLACPSCRGSGYGMAQEVMGLQVRPVCERCHGRGRREGRAEEGPCRPCRGVGWVLGSSTIEVHIPPGVDAGMRLRVAGQGRPLLKGGRGDLFLVVKVRPGPYRRRSQDLEVDLPVPERLLKKGGHVPLETPVGTLDVTIPRGSRPGAVVRLTGRGLPSFSDRPQGDLLVKLAAQPGSA